jgi:ADP-ribose pyrophosphatase YjhB (NUDIX family)
MMTNPKWLDWAQQLQAHAQNGLTYTTNPFDAERFQHILEIATEILATYAACDLPVMREIIQAQTGYMTPKLDIRGVIFKGNKILLVKELSDGKWTLPGGWVDINETPSEAVQREVREESGYEVKAVRLLALYDRNKHGHPAFIFHLYKVYILCDLVGGQPQNSIETGGAEFFEENEYPPLSIARTTTQVLARLFHLYRNPHLPAEFD